MDNTQQQAMGTAIAISALDKFLTTKTPQWFSRTIVAAGSLAVIALSLLIIFMPSLPASVQNTAVLGF
jgi:hypothetical protein